jgi:enamine deaminase RidA (YjgF/YER057c/UK114 family)
MSDIRRFSTGRSWETNYRYSRAIAYGGFFETCLTSPSAGDGSIVCVGDVYGQTHACLRIIADVLAQAGYEISDVVRSDIYMLDTKAWELAGRAHREILGETRPVLSFIGCANFWHPDILVEVAIKAYRREAAPAQESRV